MPSVFSFSTIGTVGRCRRVVLHQARDPSEEGAGVHLADLLGRRRLHVRARRHRDLGGRAVGLAPGAERRQLVLLLQRVHDVVVLRAVRLHLPVHPHEPRRRPVRLLDTGRRRALPARAGDQEARGAGPGRALADRREHVAPHVEERDHVVAPARIRHRQHERFLVEVRPGRREQRVEPGPRHRPERGVRVLRHDRELVDGRRDLTRGGHRGPCRLRQVHHDEREAVEVRLQAVDPGPAFPMYPRPEDRRDEQQDHDDRAPIAPHGVRDSGVPCHVGPLLRAPPALRRWTGRCPVFWITTVMFLALASAASSGPRRCAPSGSVAHLHGQRHDVLWRVEIAVHAEAEQRVGLGVQSMVSESPGFRYCEITMRTFPPACGFMATRPASFAAWICCGFGGHVLMDQGPPPSPCTPSSRPSCSRRPAASAAARRARRRRPASCAGGGWSIEIFCTLPSAP